MFKIDLAALKAVTLAAEKAITAREGLRTDAHNAVVELAGSGFVGQAQYASMEAFLTWIKGFEQTSDALLALSATLDTALAAANDLCKKRDALPALVGAASRCSQEGSGELILADNYEMVANSTYGLTTIDYPGMEDILSRAEALAGTLPSAGALQECLTSLSLDLAAQKAKLASFGWSYALCAYSILQFDSTTASALAALKEGDLAALEGFLGELGALAQSSDDLAELGAGLAWLSGGFEDPKNIKVSFDPINRKWIVSGYADTDGLTSRYNANAIFRNPKLAKLVAFKALSKLAAPLTVVIGVYDAYTSYTAEFTRNPYLPEQVSAFRAQVATEVSVAKTTTTVAASVVAGAAFGVIGGPIGMIAGAVVGLLVGFGVDRLSNSDFDNNNKTLTDDYIDYRMSTYETAGMYSYYG